MQIQAPAVQIVPMLPEICLFLWALAVMALDLFARRRSARAGALLAMAGIVVSGIILRIVSASGSPAGGFGMMFQNDPVAVFFKYIFLGAAFLAIGSSFGALERRIVNHRGEFLGLILFSTVGMMFLASSNELLSLYIGLELATIPLFVLAAFYREEKISVEAGIKYLVAGALSSALLLYGLSFLYGLSGATDLIRLKAQIAPAGLIFVMALLSILAGLGFKLALPPFHQWAPDVYEGAPTPIASFLSVGSKAAGLVAFAKIMVGGLGAFHDPALAPNDWGRLVGALAIAAMVIGNAAAIPQQNIKRMMAYSSIAQAGYIMTGMLAINDMGLASVAFYMFAYMFANMGAFAVIAIFEDKTGSCRIASYAGLGKSSPFMAASLSVFLLSLAGIPPLAGFLSKYYVFAAAIKMAGAGTVWLYWVVGTALLTSVFALYYYAGVIKTMYFDKAENPHQFGLKSPVMFVVIAALIGVIFFGLFPEPVLRAASHLSISWNLLGQN